MLDCVNICLVKKTVCSVLDNSFIIKRYSFCYHYHCRCSLFSVTWLCSQMSTSQEALRQYVAKSRAQLRQILQRLNWTEQGVQQLHRPLSQQEYVGAEQLPPSCCTAAKHSVKLNAAQLQQLLPGKHVVPIDSFEDLQLNYSAEQKLILYEHVLSCTPRQQLSFEQQANFAELVAETKRAHQKARRHRKSKMTLLEEMQQLVHLQMQALTQQIRQQQQKQEQQQQRFVGGERRERKLGRWDDRRRSRSRSKGTHRSSRSRSHLRTSHNSSKNRSTQRSTGNSNAGRGSDRSQRNSRSPNRNRRESRSPNRKRTEKFGSTTHTGGAVAVVI
ncbi:probable basic-leucine zipper transcription factor Q [Drosophila hydei]|uniref:Probable basic-leucine zipper transcription factor Q n=1 Tax=Drosophila hydei TaxID=7224 RepID=A0A6J2SUV6_DROHY|nr:probable basic-leucine zipper transcription factor Q [Drosophila hydei]